MTSAPTTFVATNDLAGITRGRSVPGDAEDQTLARGLGWVPANLALTPLGVIAPNSFGSTGDLRLMPDPSSRVAIPAHGEDPAVTLYLADQTTPDGSPWAGCPRSFARRALDELRAATGIEVTASFEHEFVLEGDGATTAPFSLARHRAAEPFGSDLVDLVAAAGLEPENWLPEYGTDQFELTLRPTDALAAADRAVVLKELVRDHARRHGRSVTFAPLLDPDGTGNGVHVHLSFRGPDGELLLHDESRPAGLSLLGHRFAAGILAHAPAILALAAPSPVSYLRLTPHRWSAGGIFLAERNREALLRICPTSTAGGGVPARQYNLEFRAADATANPWLVLGALVRAGLSGITADAPEEELPTLWPESVTEAELVGVPTLPRDLEEALAALEGDAAMAEWLGPVLLDTHLAVKRFELDAVADLDPAARCATYADVY